MHQCIPTFNWHPGWDDDDDDDDEDEDEDEDDPVTNKEVRNNDEE